MSGAPASPDASPAAPRNAPQFAPQFALQPAHSPDPELASGHDCALELQFDAEVVSRFLDWLAKRGLHVCTAQDGLYRAYGRAPAGLISEWMGLDPRTVGWDAATRTAMVGRTRPM